MVTASREHNWERLHHFFLGNGKQRFRGRLLMSNSEVPTLALLFTRFLLLGLFLNFFHPLFLHYLNWAQIQCPADRILVSIQTCIDCFNSA